MAKPINRPELMDVVRRSRPAGLQVPTPRVSINSLGIRANDLLGRLRGDADLLLELISIFSAESVSMLAQLREAY
jgi:hypothetical protein